MGRSTDGILAYGYDLGGEETGMEYPDWYDEEDNDGFEDAAMERLLAATGFTEVYDDGREGYFARKREAEAALGVELVNHCSCEYPMWILAAVSQRASRGTPKVIDFTVPEDADQRLAWAAEVLGLTVSGKPQWLLASNWC